MLLQNLMHKGKAFECISKSRMKKPPDFSSPAATFDTQLMAIKSGGLEALRATLDPDSRNKDIQLLRTDDKEAEEWIAFKKIHLNEIRLGSEINEHDNVKLYKLIDPSAATSGLVFHKHDGVCNS